MKEQILVVGKLPRNAQIDIPANEPQRVISRHRDTQRGLLNAIKSALSTHEEYTQNKGTAAAHAIWIHANGKSWQLDQRDILQDQYKIPIERQL